MRAARVEPRKGQQFVTLDGSTKADCSSPTPEETIVGAYLAAPGATSWGLTFRLVQTLPVGGAVLLTFVSDAWDLGATAAAPTTHVTVHASLSVAHANSYMTVWVRGKAIRMHATSAIASEQVVDIKLAGAALVAPAAPEQYDVLIKTLDAAGGVVDGTTAQYTVYRAEIGPSVEPPIVGLYAPVTRG